VPRVLFVGDSSTYGFDVSDGAAFWSIVARDAGVEPIVAAAPGYSSYQSRVLLGRFLPLHPDWVVLFVGGYNDHRPRQYYEDAEIPARMARRHAAWHGVRALQAGELVANLAGRWIDRNLRDSEQTLRVPPARFDENLRAMLDAARAADARTLVLIPPFSPELRAARPILAVYEETLLARAREAGAERIDLGPLFADAEAFRFDHVHPSALGHQRIAAAITAVLRAAQ